MGEMNKRLLLSSGLLKLSCIVKEVLEKLNFEIIKIEYSHFDKGFPKKSMLAYATISKRHLWVMVV